MSIHDSHRAQARQTTAASTFVDFVGTLVGDFDVIDVLTQLTARCVDLLRVDAAGILLADATGHLRVVGASHEKIQLLELFQLQNEEGPCLDCYTTGEVVTADNLNASSRWPTFAVESVAAGYPSVYAIPLRHTATTLGCLNLFMSDRGPLEPTDIVLAQALADVASLTIVQSHANRQSNDRASYPRHALESRITIEHAKGMIAEHTAADIHTAFELLRAYANDHDRSLIETADELVMGTISVSDFDHHPRRESDELTVETSHEGPTRIVRLAGELDSSTRVVCFNACLNGDDNGDVDQIEIEIDISGVTFMDCSGYGALVAARLVLEQRGAGFALRHASGQPAYLLGRLAELE